MKKYIVVSLLALVLGIAPSTTVFAKTATVEILLNQLDKLKEQIEQMQEQLAKKDNVVTPGPKPGYNYVSPTKEILNKIQKDKFDIKEKIVVVSPNGSERWAVGSTQKIRWTGGDASQPVSILLNNRTNIYTVRYLVKKALNDGKESWTIPKDLPAGEYVMSIQGCYTCAGFPKGYSWDYSNKPFTVTH